VHNCPCFSLKKLYGLAYLRALEKESQGLTHEEAHRQVSVIADYLNFVWKNKRGKAVKGKEGSAPDISP
jgi:hypothetical protein